MGGIIAGRIDTTEIGIGLVWTSLKRTCGHSYHEGIMHGGDGAR